jgi:hypothetical protein
MVKLLAALAAVPVCCMALVVGTGVLVVDVQESGPRGHRIIVPVPLLVAQAAARFVPAAHKPLDVPQLKAHFREAERFAQALSDAPDGEYVRVEEREQTVAITKVRGTLQVRVHGRDEEVAVDVPLAMVGELLRRCQSGSCAPADLVAALREARLTNLADVRSRDAHVRVAVW